MNLIQEYICDYRVKKHKGFFTVERLYQKTLFGFKIKKEWRSKTELKMTKLGVMMYAPKHYRSYELAKMDIKREVEATLVKANKKGFKPTLKK